MSDPPRLPAGKDLPQTLALEAFAQIHWGKHWEQAAPFVAWARRTGHHHASSAEWRALLSTFQNRPAGMR
jgi:hypothetical protein